MKNFQIKAKILSQKKIKGSYWYCELSAAEIAKNALPGQFINIKVNNDYEPLLRRPISIRGVSGAKIKIFYEVVGKATETLAQRKKGEPLDIIGPLGNGFDSGGKKTGNRRQILVAGGMGVAPLIFLAEKLAELKTQNSKLKTLVLVGARTKDQLLCVKEFKDFGCDVKIATDDGSAGFKGRVSDLLKHLLSTIRHHRLSTIYACGPKPMLREVADIADGYRIPAQLSLEEHMSCGIGACLGCAIKVKSQKVPACRQAGKVKSGFEYKRVCKEGPVFNAEEIIW